jgi:uncharacterized protein
MVPLIEILQEEFQQILIEKSKNTHRFYEFPEAPGIIKVAIGMRRSGKTCFLWQTIRSYISEGITPDRILYINFEDDRILPMDFKAMGQLIDAWYTIHPKNHEQRCYLFLDEVQNIEGWATVLRRILDTKNVELYVTGSSAKLLSTEIATSLRGRCLTVEISPYSYLEYLTAQGLSLPTPPFGKKMLDTQRSHLLHYFQMGGFPGVQLISSSDRLEMLQSYVETVTFRDVVERYRVTNISLLKYLIHSLLKNVGALFSVNKFYNDIKSQGYKVSKDTLHTYLGYIEDAFLIFAVPVFTESLRQSQTIPKKIYAVDNGLILANTFNMSANTGKLLENQVYLDLRRQGKKIFYYQTKDGYEIDFVTQDREGVYELIQVVWEKDDPKTLEREERALLQAEQELGIKGKLVDGVRYIQDIARF